MTRLDSAPEGVSSSCFWKRVFDKVELPEGSSFNTDSPLAFAWHGRVKRSRGRWK